MRVATALELRLLRAPMTRPEGVQPEGLQTSPAQREGEREGEQPDWSAGAGRERDERDRADLDRADLDREREREPVSLPVLLRTLDGVAVDAAALPDPEPADLPTLRELLAQVASDPPAPPAARKTPANLRARLAGSAIGSVLALAPPPPPPGIGGGFAMRRATGPPRR